MSDPRAAEMSLDDEKIREQHYEQAAIQRSEIQIRAEEAINDLSPAEQKKVFRRIDLRLTTVLGALYTVSIMDRTNLGAASIAGMTASLGLGIGSRYSIITCIFFITYVAFQPVATVILRKLGPRIWITTLTICWGVTMIGFGFVPDWTVMVGLRVLLGIFEAGFFPSAIYLLSTWYARYDLQKRVAIFYFIGSFASALAGILAYGIMQMDGLANLAGWRWIFIMEGVVTCALGIVGYMLLVDFPELAQKSWRFLSQREVNFVVAKIRLDRNDVEPEPFNIRKYLAAALDLKVLGFAWLFGMTTTNAYAISYFLPIILRNGMGFSLAASQCLVAPPYAAAGIVMMVQAYYSDRMRWRSPFIIGNSILGLIGTSLLGFATNNAVRYFGVFLATIAANSNSPAIITWQSNNVRGQWKRALTSATAVSAAGIGGIVGSTVFRSQDAPGYVPGIIACIIANGIVILVSLGLILKFTLANKRAAAGGKIIEGHHGFRYTL